MLAADFPSVPSNRAGLAQSHLELGKLLRLAGRPAEAELSFRQALSIGETLVLEFPTSAGYRKELSVTCQGIAALLHYQMGRPSEAERFYRGALELLSKLVSDFPAMPEYRDLLAIGQNNLGLLLVDLGRLQEAESFYQASLAIKSKLVADDPANPEFRFSLSGILIDLAELQRRHHRPAEARRLLEQAQPHIMSALKVNPQHLGYRMFYAVGIGTLAETLADLGDHARAAEQAGLLARIATDPAADVYREARVLARCSALAADDGKLPEARRRELAWSYADAALASLQRSVASGWKDGVRARRDPDLAPLRARGDFQRLMMDVDFPAQPFRGDTARP